MRGLAEREEMGGYERGEIAKREIMKREIPEMEMEMMKRGRREMQMQMMKRGRRDFQATFTSALKSRVAAVSSWGGDARASVSSARS